MKLFCRCEREHGEVRRLLDDTCKTVDGLKRERAALNTSFEELQDKVFRWMQRTNKRERDAERAAGNGEAQAPTDEPYARHPVVRRIMQRRGLIGREEE